jgi:signal transduction histidine kinase
MQKDLIANVSHDLRTPLTMIAGYTEAMRDLPGEATPENMQIVIDETERLTSLVNDLLEVSKYQNGEQILHKARFNLTQTVRRTIERYAKLKLRDGYDFTFDAEFDVYVDADERRILQVLYNLINNAVNYTGEDKRVIITQVVEECRDGRYVTIAVRDTGIGIPKEELPLVWERYYKARDFHKRANMGTGLGLSIVKNILILHNAQFGVESKVGEGSAFHFTLPVAED